jgi:hypothetical protein
VNRESVPLGAPIELTLRFDSSPSFTGLDENYYVLLHFLNDDNDLMWEADHEPSIPTSAWQPGQVISYTHRAIVPMYPYIGEATVAVGLYSTITGQRLILAGEDLGQRLYSAATLNLEPQAESSFLLYEEGWHQEEYDPDSRLQWKWTSDHGSLSLRNPNSDAMLFLQLDGRPDLVGEPQEVAISVGETVLHEITLATSDMQFLELDLPADEFGDSEIVRLDLTVNPTFIPAEIGEGDDSRRLGIRVFYAFLEVR